jgi:NAD(P)-dependent dehydrogenase (short-subunit alcohol dehydrogenase family)
MADFTTADIPSQAGKTVVITGTGGLGYETALALAGKGAEVILAGRNAAKGAESIAKIRSVYPAANIVFEPLDLASLASVAAFAERFKAAHPKLDILIDNAAVMSLPARQTTADGFEMQFGTNYLGHFALTAGLLPVLRATPACRVVTVSSSANKLGARIALDDLNAERRYVPWAAYQQSKLANMIFALELQRRSDANGWGILSNAAHPGFARTDLIANGPGTDSFFSKASTRLIAPILSHSAAAGALPTLFAATSRDAKPAGYYGPNGLFELKGAVGPAVIPARAKDTTVANELWHRSEQMTGATFS